MDGAGEASSAGANNAGAQNGEAPATKTVMVLAATNRPQDIDEAIRRRLEKRVYIPLPTEVGRKELFKINLKGLATDEDVDWDALTKMTDGYSGADISNVCRDAAMMPMRRVLASGKHSIQEIAAMKEQYQSIPLNMQDF